MYCSNCGAELNINGNFCPYCGTRLENATVSGTLLNKAVSTAEETNCYNLVLVSRGDCDAVTAGDLLEDVFGYTDAESGNLVKMAPVVVAENLTADEAATIAQMYTEYGMQVSITDDADQFVDMADSAISSVFDAAGNLVAGVAAVIGALTVANRISSYRRYRKPSLMERIFHLRYEPKPPVYRRNFRPRLDHKTVMPRKTIRRPGVGSQRPIGNHTVGKPMGGSAGHSGMGGHPGQNNHAGQNSHAGQGGFGAGGHSPQNSTSAPGGHGTSSSHSASGNHTSSGGHTSSGSRPSQGGRTGNGGKLSGGRKGGGGQFTPR